MTFASQILVYERGGKKRLVWNQREQRFPKFFCIWVSKNASKLPLKGQLIYPWTAKSLVEGSFVGGNFSYKFKGWCLSDG